MYRKPTDAVAKELDAIKKLLILQLVTSGVQAKDIAQVLGLDKSDMSRLVSTRGIKKKGSDSGE
jgi:predicted transcriptional regulator